VEEDWRTTAKDGRNIEVYWT